MATCARCGAFGADNISVCSKCGGQMTPAAKGATLAYSHLLAGLPPPPSTNMPGVFPREHLSRDEILVFETRPNILPFILNPVIGFAILQILALLFILVEPSATYSSTTCLFFEMIFVFFFVIGLVSGILDWMGRKYALTSDKIFGLRGLVSRHLHQCTPDKVQNITLEQGVLQRLLGYGSIVFWTAGMGGGMSGAGFEYRAIGGGGVVWSKINDPVTLKRYAEEVVNVFQKKKKMEEFRDMAAAFAQAPGPMAPPSVPPPPGEIGTFCPACGTPAQPSMPFCAKCGRKLLA